MEPVRRTHHVLAWPFALLGSNQGGCHCVRPKASMSDSKRSSLKGARDSRKLVSHDSHAPSDAADLGSGARQHVILGAERKAPREQSPGYK
jgi:hypothetical protein